jgi:hypothetical protein
VRGDHTLLHADGLLVVVLLLLQVLTILQGNGPYSNAGIVLEAEAFSSASA